MKNNLKKIFFLLVTILCANFALADDTKTYVFSSTTDLNEWTIVNSAPNDLKHGIDNNCDGHSFKNEQTDQGNYFWMHWIKSNLTFSMTSTESFSNITNLTLDFACNDNSKPSINISIVADNGTETPILTNGGLKASFNNPGADNWKRGQSFTVNNISGKIKFSLTAPSSGKYAAFDNIVVTYSKGTGSGGSQTTTYTITYNNNGHGTAPSQVTGATALPATLPTLTESGWTFDGWYTDQALTTPAVAGATISSNTTLYAKWTQNQQQGGGQQGGGTTGEDYCWNFSDAGWAGGATKDGLSVGSDVTFEGNSKSIDGYSFTQRLKLGGKFSATKCISFAVSGPCTITVYGMSGKSGETRALTIASGAYNGTALTTNFLSNDGTAIGKDTYNYTGTATTLFIGGTTAALNLYQVCVSYESAGPTVSSDATLSNIQVDGQTIAGFSASSTSYNATIPATQTTAPVVTATANHTAATVDITQAQLPITGSTTATIIVTAEDGTTKTYTITFTRAELSHDADLKDIKVNGQSIPGFSASSTNYSVQVPYSSTIPATITATTNNTAATAIVTGYNTVEGTATITVTAEDGTTTKIYTVNITKAAPSTDATLSALQYNGTSVPNFSANTFTYSVELPFGTAAAANVTATPNYSAADVQITQPTAAAGTATVTVTAEDGTTTNTYTITFTVAEEDVPPVPSTTLTLHTPGTYEDNGSTGGYGTPLKVANGREYEVYYLGKNDDSFIGVRAGQQQSSYLLTNSTTSSSSDFIATDQWFKGHVIGSEGKDYLKSGNSPKANAIGEFDDLPGDIQIKGGDGNGYMELYVSGYDQFSIVAADGDDDANKGKHFVVKIDNIPQQMVVSKNTVTVRPFAMTTGRHVIRVEALGASNCKLYGFSLRVAQEPRLKKIKGNDSTQVILQTLAPKPITYFTKYNSMGRTELEWDGPAATGITLSTGNTNALGDTLILGGTALCPVGTYHFHVVAYNANNKETSRESGTFTVESKISAQTDTIITAYTNESIDEIKFRYYALDASDITIDWQPSTPAGITASGTNGIYTISGTPTQTGTYNYTVTVAGGNSIPGQIKVLTLDLGNNPILYLYKNNLAYEKDGIYKYLTEDQHLNLVARKAKSELRPADQYAPYTLIIISEDVDATNPEVLAIARGEGQQKPVLNMKSFTYSPNRLDWGEPDNGSLINREITVIRADHPIFTAMGKKTGDKIVVLDTITTKGLMPAAVDYEGTLCLATALTRGRDYMSNGTSETFLHEVPDSLRGGAKYICMPISIYSSNNLSTEGKRFVNATISYLRGTAASVALPELQITAATIHGKAAVPNKDDEITLSLVNDATLDLEKMNCTFTLKDNNTHATYVDYSGNKHIINLQGEVIDLSDTRNGVTITVTDYINVRHYTLRIDLLTALDKVYTTGEWINIYDIQGRLVTTTNEDFYTMSLPHGIYMIQTSRGIQKVMK